MLEAILEILLQGFGELLLQIIFEVFAGRSVEKARERRIRKVLAPPAAPPMEWGPVGRTVGFALLGGLLGVVSAFLVPSHIFPSPVVRRVFVVINPLLAGLIMAAIGKWRERLNRPRPTLYYFWPGFGFALAMSIARYLFAGYVLGD